MKRRESEELTQRKRVPFNLQFFAEEGDGDGAEGGDGSGSDDGNPEGGKSKTVSFDDFLKESGNQSEFDRRVQQAINTAITNAKEKWQIMTDDRVSEAEKLAKMNKEEKADYLRQKREKELSDREAAVTRKELMAEARNTLTEKKLPIGLAMVLDYTDANSCKKSMETVETAFRAAVESAVKERLKGGEPPKKASGQKDSVALAERVEALMRGDI